MEMLAGLIHPKIRTTGACEVAAAAGAEHLCIFVRDPELNRFLPGQGFPQRLPRGAQWAAFLCEIEAKGRAESELCSPYTNAPQRVAGFLLSHAAIAVFFGGSIRQEQVEALAPGLRLVAALLSEELRAKLAEIRASAARSVADEARELAEALSEAHDKLSLSLYARELLLEEVNRKQEQLQLARRISGIGVWEIDIAEQTIQLTAGACEIFDLPVDCTQLSLKEMIEMIHPEDRGLVQEVFSTVLERQEAVQVAFRIKWANGTLHWIENRSTVVRDPEGSAIVIGISLDITQRVLTEEALIRSEKLAAAGRLAASIAHEINNPLAGLVNLIYLARESDSMAETKELLTVADQELTRVSAVARQALGFYRDINSAVRFDLGMTLRQVMALVRKQLAGNGSSLVAELPDGKVDIDGWPGEIKQAVSNLLLNAAQASARGSSIRLRLMRGTEAVWLTIADHGHGISQDHLRHIFEPFFTTRKDSGTGLGLWVTHQIVEKHHGRMRVRSSTHPNRHGTVFLLKFPPAGAVAELTATENHLRDRWQDLNG